MNRKCDCKKCILGWEERGLEDCNVGCHYYSDLDYNGPICHAPNFVKKILLNKEMKRKDKYMKDLEDKCLNGLDNTLWKETD